jgi:hypothetical protein
MHTKTGIHAWSLLMMILMLLLFQSGAQAQDEVPTHAKQKGLQQRIDFGNAQILGQSIKSGAVYLMHRKKSDIKNMLEVRKDYRKEIIEDYALEKTAIAENTTTEKKDQPKQ